MLPSFYIENFRIFNTLSINRLGRVNLIVGRNNAGKSTFLEAILLYASNASIEVIYNLIASRQENYDSNLPHNLNILSLSPIRHLFKGHKIPNLIEPGFTLAIKEDQESLSIRTAAFIIEISTDKRTRRKLNPEELENIEPDYIDPDIEIFVVSEHGESTQLLFSQNWEFRDSYREARFRLNNQRTQNKYGPIQLVSTQGLSDEKAAQLWDAINLTDLEKDVIKALTLVEKSIIGLAFVEGERSRDRVPVVKLENQEERIPLKSLGDGVTRVFHIILSLVNAKGGVLLIDEFENGLHWAVQESVWKTVFQLAEMLNVQVFCTTHSRDCVHGFDAAWQDHQQAGAFFRLFTRNGSVSVQEYDIETLSDSLETDVEVR
ncbi:MAG: AAA family ATPase [Methylovulum sp.]|nr:AAA family ATPase [Methylovulum sp.]